MNRIVTLLVTAWAAESLSATALYQKSPLDQKIIGDATNQNARWDWTMRIEPKGKPKLEWVNRANVVLRPAGLAEDSRRLPAAGEYHGGHAEVRHKIDSAAFDAAKFETNVKGWIRAEAQAPVETGGSTLAYTQISYRGTVIGQAGVDTGLGQLGAKDDSTIASNSADGYSSVSATLDILIDGSPIATEVFLMETLGGLATMFDTTGLLLTLPGSGATSFRASGDYRDRPWDNYAGSAAIVDGVFSATGFLATAPWEITAGAGRVVSAYLPIANFPAPEIIWTPSDGLPHELEFRRSAAAYDTAPEVPEPALTIAVAVTLGAMAASRRVLSHN